MILATRQENEMMYNTCSGGWKKRVRSRHQTAPADEPGRISRTFRSQKSEVTRHRENVADCTQFRPHRPNHEDNTHLPTSRASPSASLSFTSNEVKVKSRRSSSPATRFCHTERRSGRMTQNWPDSILGTHRCTACLSHPISSICISGAAVRFVCHRGRFSRLWKASERMIRPTAFYSTVSVVDLSS